VQIARLKRQPQTEMQFSGSPALPTKGTRHTNRLQDRFHSVRFERYRPLPRRAHEQP
jgi:hypothetical protein